MNRQPRIRFSALTAKSSKQEVKVFQDNLDNKPQFTPNQAVFVRNFGKGAKWIPGTIVGTASPRNFEVQVGDIIYLETTSRTITASIHTFHTMVRVSSCAPAT